MERRAYDPNIASIIGSLASLDKATASLRALYKQGNLGRTEFLERCLKLHDRGDALLGRLDVSLQDRIGTSNLCNSNTLFAFLGEHDNVPREVLDGLVERLGTSKK